MIKKHLYFKKKGEKSSCHRGQLCEFQIKASRLTLLNTKLQAEIKLEKYFFPQIPRFLLGVGNKSPFFDSVDEVVEIVLLDSEGLDFLTSQSTENYLRQQPEKIMWTDRAGIIWGRN